MFTFKDIPEINQVINKATDIAIKTIDFQKAIFAESMKYFNDVTDKYFYAFTVQTAEAANKSVEYAKENITTGSKKVANLFANSK